MIQNALREQFNQFIEANDYERTDARNGLCNGTYERQLKTRVGMITLHVCRDRDGKFKTDLFARYQRSEKSLVLGIIEMYLEGAATRNVGKIIEELCGFDVSKSTVSTLTMKLDEDIKQWRLRPLVEIYLYLIVDARYEKVRENGRVISKAFVTAIGITNDGKREIIGCWVINSESFEAWNACFTELRSRGLSGVTYVVSDENAGLKSAIQKHFQDTQWQRCQVHFMRNFMGKLAKSELIEGIKLLQDVFAAPSKNDALKRMKALAERLSAHKKESVALWLEDNIEDTLAVYNLPEDHRKKMRTTNMIERLNQELKRRSRVIRIFPNEQSCLRLLSAICWEFSEQWDERRYLNM